MRKPTPVELAIPIAFDLTKLVWQISCDVENRYKNAGYPDLFGRRQECKHIICEVFAEHLPKVRNNIFATKHGVLLEPSISNNFSGTAQHQLQKIQIECRTFSTRAEPFPRSVIEQGCIANLIFHETMHLFSTKGNSGEHGWPSELYYLNPYELVAFSFGLAGEAYFGRRKKINFLRMAKLWPYWDYSQRYATHFADIGSGDSHHILARKFKRASRAFCSLANIYLRQMWKTLGDPRVTLLQQLPKGSYAADDETLRSCKEVYVSLPRNGQTDEQEINIHTR